MKNFFEIVSKTEKKTFVQKYFCKTTFFNRNSKNQLQSYTFQKKTKQAKSE